LCKIFIISRLTFLCLSVNILNVRNTEELKKGKDKNEKLLHGT